MILTLEETKNWLRVDNNEDDKDIKRLIGAAEMYLTEATGKRFESGHYLAELFCLVLITDWYENRDLTGSKIGEKVRFTIQSMTTQLTYS